VGEKVAATDSKLDSLLRNQERLASSLEKLSTHLQLVASGPVGALPWQAPSAVPFGSQWTQTGPSSQLPSWPSPPWQAPSAVPFGSQWTHPGPSSQLPSWPSPPWQAPSAVPFGSQWALPSGLMVPITPPCPLRQRTESSAGVVIHEVDDGALHKDSWMAPYRQNGTRPKPRTVHEVMKHVFLGDFPDGAGNPPLLQAVKVYLSDQLFGVRQATETGKLGHFSYWKRHERLARIWLHELEVLMTAEEKSLAGPRAYGLEQKATERTEEIRGKFATSARSPMAWTDDYWKAGCPHGPAVKNAATILARYDELATYFAFGGQQLKLECRAPCPLN
jgi:hypothetical protein